MADSSLNTFLDLINRPLNNLPNPNSIDPDFWSRLVGRTFGNVQNMNQGMIDQNKQDLLNGTTGIGALGRGMTQPMSIADQLQQQLNSLQAHNTPIDEIRKLATSQVNAQYDPQINQLLRDMGATKTRATQNEAKSKDMYNSLAQNLVDQLPAIQQNMQNQQQQASDRYSNAQSDLQAQYDQQKNDQQNVLQQLGIQAAAPDANKQMATDQAYFQQQNDLSKNQALDQLMQQGSSDQQYQRSMADTSRLAGTNAANDIASQLEAYLQDATGKLEDLKGSKANALTSLIGQMQQQDTQNAQNQYNNAFNQMMQMNNLQRNLTNDQNQNQLDQLNMMLKQQQLQQQSNASPFKGTSGMTGLSNFLSEQYPNNPNEASALSSLITSVLSNPDVQMGRRQDGPLNSVPITNEYLIQLLRDQAQKAGITSPTDINNAIDALLAYKGQLR